MSKICSKCLYKAEDSAVFCPACGSALEASPAAPASPRPIYAQPLQNQSAVSQTPAQKPSAKSRLPYIFIGVGAAAVIFLIALIIALTTGKTESRNTASSTAPTTSAATAAPTASPATLAGAYTWTNGANGATGTLTINSENIGVFTIDGSGSLEIEFDPEDHTATFVGADGTEYNAVYTLSGDDLSITTDGYTDTFRRQ